MPISLDTSIEEIRKTLISSYENKLRNSLKIDDELLSMIINNTKSKIGRTCRYVSISISIVKNVDGIHGYGMLFDLKHKVPIIQSETPCHVISYPIDLACKWEDAGRVFAFSAKGLIISIISIKKNEMFREVHINSKYCDKYSEELKTYKRFIELKGE